MTAKLVPLPAPDRLDEVLAEIRAMRAEVAALRTLLVPSAPGDPRARLFEAIYEALGEAPFLALDVLDEATRVEALAGAVLELAGSGGLRRLAQILARETGVAGGYRLERAARTRDGALYRVVRLGDRT